MERKMTSNFFNENCGLNSTMFETMPVFSNRGTPAPSIAPAESGCQRLPETAFYTPLTPISTD
jgi:hypothetical protein